MIMMLMRKRNQTNRNLQRTTRKKSEDVEIKSTESNEDSTQIVGKQFCFLLARSARCFFLERKSNNVQ